MTWAVILWREGGKKTESNESNYENYKVANNVIGEEDKDALMIKFCVKEKAKEKKSWNIW